MTFRLIFEVLAKRDQAAPAVARTPLPAALAMEDKRVRFQAHAIFRETLEGLLIRRELFGARHTLSSQAGLITITLPAAPHDGVLERRECLLADEYHPDHTWFEVGGVDMRMDLAAPIEFEGSTAEFNSLQVIRSPTASATFELVSQAAVEAWEKWKRTLRWAALAPEIAISDLTTAYDATRARGFKIFRNEDGVLFRGHGGSVSVPGGGKVTHEAWATAQLAFNSGSEPPVWSDFLIDAHRQSRVGNYRAAVISAAVAAETVIRALVHQVQPHRPAKYADRTPVGDLLKRWEALVGWTAEETNARGRNDVLALLMHRNAILHRGVAGGTELERAMDALLGLSAFVFACDTELAHATGTAPTPKGVDRALDRLTEPG